MFGKKEKVPVPTYDVTQKIKKTWWGGTKLIPTTKSEQRKLKAEILKRNPNAIVLDGKAKKEKELVILYEILIMVNGNKIMLII